MPCSPASRLTVHARRCAVMSRGSAGSSTDRDERCGTRDPTSGLLVRQPRAGVVDIGRFEALLDERTTSTRRLAMRARLLARSGGTGHLARRRLRRVRRRGLGPTRSAAARGTPARRRGAACRRRTCLRPGGRDDRPARYLIVGASAAGSLPGPADVGALSVGSPGRCAPRVSRLPRRARRRGWNRAVTGAGRPRASNPRP